jgi:DNA polymerase elongation subunit (family B)
MKFYTSAHQYGSKILVRGVHNGVRFNRREDFSPVLYVKSKEEGVHKSLYGDNLQPVEFESNNDAKEFIQTYGEVDNFPIYGQTNFGYQYITHKFPGEIQWDMNALKIQTIDIETKTEFGFPDINNPLEEILLITVKDLVSRQIITFGCGNFDDVNSEEITALRATGNKFLYVKCDNERDLLQTYIRFHSDNHPDIITGWNVELFDIAYLIARVERLFNDENATKKKFSPWGLVQRKNMNVMGREMFTYEMKGIAVLDYLDLFKKFTYSNQESYKLDHIASVELGKNKLENPYESFREFYTKDWQKFVEYNVRDVEIVDELERKLKLIELILTMAYDAKCNYNDVFSQVRTWDCLLYNHLYDKNIHIPQKRDQQGRGIEGAFVQEPKPGKYDWVVSFDATSLYPSIIMQYNMSPETMVNGYVKDTTVRGLLDKTFDLDDLKDNDYCMTSNGYCYNRTKQGLFPEIVEKFFDDRQRYKKLMITAQKEYELTKDEKLKNDISKYNNFQMARKIQLNSLFGAMGNEYFRYYDARVAEGITMTGQYIIQEVGKALDVYLNKVVGTNGHNYSFYSDTDSCYISLEPLVSKFYPDMDRDKLIGVLDKICEEKITEAINKSCDGLADYTNAFQKKIIFKREAIAERGIWVAKKRYALNVYDNEGVRYDEPKLKVMGLEIVRSSTPAPVRKSLKEAVRLCLTSDEATLQKFIEETREAFYKMSPEEIAFPRGVNGLSKYTSTADIYGKGTPMHVRGALMYNHMIKKANLDKKYELIQEGEKIKFLYLKEPNTMHENCIAFLGIMPKELDIHRYIDYKMMFQKAFLDPLNMIVDGLSWSTEPKATLEDLFA